MGELPSGHSATLALASVQCSFGESLSAAVRELSRQTQSLPALVVLALYVASVSRWCGQRDFVAPFLIAGRNSEHEAVVGYFTHIVFLRVHVGERDTFKELLKRVSNEFYRAAAFRQDFGRVAAQQSRLLSGALCQWLSWHPAAVAGLETGDPARPAGLDIERMPPLDLEELTNVPPAMVGLEISFFEAAGDIAALAIYRNERFAQSTVQGFLTAVQATAERVTRGGPLLGV